MGRDATAEDCEQLFRQHQTFLGLPHSAALATAFVAMVRDYNMNLQKEEEEQGGGGGGGGGGRQAGGGGEEGADNDDMDADDEGVNGLVRAYGGPVAVMMTSPVSRQCLLCLVRDTYLKRNPRID